MSEFYQTLILTRTPTLTVYTEPIKKKKNLSVRDSALAAGAGG